MALEAIGDYENALASYDRALSIEPNDRTAKLNRDNLLWKTGSADKVIDRQDKHKRQHTTIKEDPDFNNIRDEPDFQKAIGGI
jgi:tetratricopeptide (TPR) repeat protein